MRAFQSPQKYIQSKGILSSTGKHIKTLFPNTYKPGIIMPEHLMKKYKSIMTSSFQSFHLYEFDGDCTYKNVKMIMNDFITNKIDHVIAFGGGKILDIGKLVAYNLKAPSIIIPSIASTDAPCTALSVVYTPNGEFEEYKFFEKNPDMVIVDTQVIAEAPSRYLVAGMGDAMSTFYEADACMRNPNAKSLIYPFIYRPSHISLAIGQKCLNILYEHGVSAKQDCESKRVSEALEQVVEANILMSGIGAESGGLALAHGLHNALTMFPKTHHFLHGEKVAFGTIVQLLVENNMDEAMKVAKFNASVGLPTSLTALHVDSTTENIQKLANLCLESGSTSWNVLHLEKKHLIECITKANSLI